MNRLDLKMGFQCNNRCVFCVQGDKRHEVDPLNTEELLARMTEARPRNEGIVLTGGEVTIRKDFFTLVRAAQKLGYRSIQIQSNGRMFANRAFCEKAVEAGANEFALALHGSFAEVHDSLTQAESFRQTLQGIAHLTEMGQTVITNTVVVRGNLFDLGNIIRLLHRIGVAQAQLAMVHPLGTAEKMFDEVTPRLDEAAPFVLRAVRAGLGAGLPTHTEAMPLCLLEDLTGAASESQIPFTEIFDADVHLADYGAYRRNEGKAKGQRCGDCALDERCEGPWREYLEHFGEDALRPVNKGDVDCRLH